MSITSNKLGLRIKSIQLVNVQLSGVNSNTATITAVDTSMTVILYSGLAVDTDTSISEQMKFVLTDSTTITVLRGTTTGVTDIRMTVLEFQQ